MWLCVARRGINDNGNDGNGIMFKSVNQIDVSCVACVKILAFSWKYLIFGYGFF